MIFWTALLLGLGGSLHCVGMCGPIALALPLTASQKMQIVNQSLLYNFGRVSTYAFLGLFFGLMGWGVALTGLQSYFSIALGMILILSAIFSISIENQLLKLSFYHSGIEKLKKKLAKVLAIRNNSSAYRVGILNGFLPCGLVYVALAGAVASGNAINGALFMLFFGLGTIPLLLGVMLFQKLSKKNIRHLQKLIPIGLIILGCLLIYRGFMLEVPADLSFWEANNFPIMCH